MRRDNYPQEYLNIFLVAAVSFLLAIFFISLGNPQ